MNKWIEWSPRSLRLLVVRKWLTLNWFDLILMVLVSTQSSNSRAVLDSLTAARFAGPKANVTNHGDYDEEHWRLWLPPKRISTTNFVPSEQRHTDWLSTGFIDPSKILLWLHLDKFRLWTINQFGEDLQHHQNPKTKQMTFFSLKKLCTYYIIIYCL